MSKNKKKNNKKQSSSARTTPTSSLHPAPPIEVWINTQVVEKIAVDLCKGKQTGPWVINDILEDCHWWHDPGEKHEVWKRYYVIGPGPAEEGMVTTMSITFSSTPGDAKAWYKQKANLLSDGYHTMTAHAAGGHPIQAILPQNWME